ncbi:MAG: hypothetical protein HYV47_00325 [Candidatus Nealsonbacteria bacterium]|nr:hypothetical protein [Candidatus Nealsonbacteria bacterium]
MGSGKWSDNDYYLKESARRVSGESAFKYTDNEMSRVSRDKWKVNQKMDPKGVTRESRDSATHPESLAIGVIFDHTGSMGETPRVLQRALARMMGTLLEKGKIANPQVLFGANGDATTDQAPLQIGQFESDITMEDDLGRLLLEGNGGHYGQESYELALYFMARHTSMDCLEKRKKKGYLFLIGDELPYNIKKSEVKSIIGDELPQNIPVEQIVAEAKEKYHIFFLIPTGAHGGRNPAVMQRWVELLGQEFVVQLENPEEIAERISLIVKTNEEKLAPAKGKTKIPTTAPKEPARKKKPGRI